jgi:hypothetical protein
MTCVFCHRSNILPSPSATWCRSVTLALSDDSYVPPSAVRRELLVTRVLDDLIPFYFILFIFVGTLLRICHPTFITSSSLNHLHHDHVNFSFSSCLSFSLFVILFMGVQGCLCTSFIVRLDYVRCGGVLD